MPTPTFSEQEEFEFRARAEAEAAAPPKENSANAAPQPYGPPFEDPTSQANRVDQMTERGPVGDVLAMGQGAVQGAGRTLQGIGTGVESLIAHPLDTSGRLMAGLGSAAKTGADAVLDAGTDPKAAIKKVLDYIKNLDPETVGNLIGSTAAGGAAGGAAGVAGDVVGPTAKVLKDSVMKPPSQTVRDLASKGVVMTPGMRGGKLASSVEQRLTSVPVVGDMIKRARGKTTEQWNRAELNEAIKDAGGSEIPAGRGGRDALAHTEQEMGKAYTRVLGKMTADLNSADPSGMTFHQFLDQTKTLTTQALEPQTAKIVNNIIDNKVILKFNQAGKATGERVKEIQEALRTEIDDLKSGNYQERKAAEALKQVSADMKAMLKRENPKLAAELDNVDRGYAKFKASSKASLYSTKNQGTYTPAQKLQAIRARDKSKDKQRFASGTAAGQKDTEAVESVIGNTEPDSGSAGRIATMEAFLGGGGVVAGHPLVGAAAAAGPMMYSQPVLKYLQKRALKRGQPYTPINPKKAQTVGAIIGAQQDQQ